MGDFETHNPTEEFINNMVAYCFQLHIIQPTRITYHSATLIDHIYFNSIDHHTIGGNLLTDLLDHLSNFLIINKISCSTHKPVFYRRDYSKFSKDNLLKEARQINWENVLPDTGDVDHIVHAFHTTVSKLVSRYAPLRKLSKREVKAQSNHG